MMMVIVHVMMVVGLPGRKAGSKVRCSAVIKKCCLLVYTIITCQTQNHIISLFPPPAPHILIDFIYSFPYRKMCNYFQIAHFLGQ